MHVRQGPGCGCPGAFSGLLVQKSPSALGAAEFPLFEEVVRPGAWAGAAWTWGEPVVGLVV
jgi:hypothetical protein